MLASVAPLAAQAADTARYAVLISGRESGTQEVWTDSAGARVARFAYQDRQRGPALVQRLELGPGGVPARLSTTGNDYLKNPVEETFALDSGRAAWHTSGGADERPVSGPAFYVSADEVPEAAAVLVRALLAAPEHRLPLLPGGEAELVEGPEHEVRAADGETRRVRLYLVTGLRLTPYPVWLDASGELFAQGGDGRFMVVRRGWEAAAPRLVAAQEAVLTAGAASLAQALGRRPAGPLVLRHATVFDAENRRMVPGQAVVVEGGRIAWVGPDSAVREPAGAERMELGGRVLLPGLWDMHVHLGGEQGLFHLAAGVTTVRDLGSGRAQIRSVRRRIEADSLVGPRILAAGMLDGPGPFAGPTEVLVDTREEAEAAVDTFAALGFAQIKVYSSVDTALVAAIAERAHARGLRVGGHVPAFMSAERAVRLGFDELHHINFLFLNFWADSVGDTRTLVRVTVPGERAAGLDLASEPVRRFVALLRERGVVVDPTLNVFERLYRGRKGVPYPGYAEVAGRLPPLARADFLLGGLPAEGEKAALYGRSFQRMLEFTRMLHEAGVPLVAGTDGLAGFSLARELELWVEAGIPPAEVLRTATLGAARVAGMERDFGTVAAGKVADLVVLDGDPLARIGDVRNVVRVIKGGRVYEADALAGAMGLAPPAP
ncbi:MAG TPA: amidohydrolase family protein [Longimicrobiaceae bacterium]|nr:amidohydrolase family protein [Longimicrobiaceae bacterium]